MRVDQRATPGASPVSPLRFTAVNISAQEGHGALVPALKVKCHSRPFNHSTSDSLSLKAVPAEIFRY